MEAAFFAMSYRVLDSAAIKFRPVHNRFSHYMPYRITVRLSERLSLLAMNISLFVLRHRKGIFTYLCSAVVMRALKVKTSYIAGFLVPGFMFLIMSRNGDPLANEKLDRVYPRNSVRYIPTDCEVEGQLKERYKLRKKIIKDISPNLNQWEASPYEEYSKLMPNENYLLLGSSRVGKSEFLGMISEELAERGHLVYKLKSDSFSMVGKDPVSFLVITYLTAMSAFSMKSPVLILDDQKNALNPDMTGGIGNGLKGGVGFEEKKFCVIAAMTPVNSTARDQWDEIYNRFNIEELKPLSPEEVTKVMSEINERKIESKYRVRVPSDVIRSTVHLLKKRVRDNLLLEKTIEVLEKTARTKRIADGPNSAVIEITAKMAFNTIKYMSFLEKGPKKN